MTVALLLACSGSPPPYRQMLDVPQAQEQLAGGGAQHCAPAAAVDALAWLAEHGHPQLGPIDPSTASGRVGELGERMRVDPKSGTSPRRVLQGLQGWLDERGEGAKVSYTGWRPHDDAYAAGRLVTADVLARGLRADAAALLNLGWYQEGPELLRVGGHWVALAGQEGDEAWVVDPSTRSGPGSVTHRCELVTLPEARLSGDYTGLPVWSGDTLGLAGLVLPEGVDRAVIDGVVVIQMAGSTP